jgi:hypothetical protein
VLSCVDLCELVAQLRRQLDAEPAERRNSGTDT